MSRREVVWDETVRWDVTVRGAYDPDMVPRQLYQDVVYGPERPTPLDMAVTVLGLWARAPFDGRDDEAWVYVVWTSPRRPGGGGMACGPGTWFKEVARDRLRAQLEAAHRGAR